MFESAELGHAVSKDEYARQVPDLRAALLEAQFELLASKKFSVVILVGGGDGAGKGETVNLLNEWLDPRHIHTHAMAGPTDEEQERPPFYRFWRALPPAGETAIFFGSWYTMPIVDRVYGRTKDRDLEHKLTRIIRFERMLVQERVLLLKFWMHLSKDQQKRRFKHLESKKETAWRVTPTDWKHFKLYDSFRDVCTKVLRGTNTALAPWSIVEGYDHRYRSLTVGHLIQTSLRRRLETGPTPDDNAIVSVPSDIEDGQPTVIDKLDLTKRLQRPDYSERLPKMQGRLNRLSRSKRFKDLSVVIVFEGADAAGKGGAIRRLSHALDARTYDIVPIAAPTEEERARPYLWRFWRQVPRKGNITVFDRSWYGRVLVERVEGFAAPSQWARAYQEINAFEEQLVDSGVVVIKFWLQISKEEQLRRFEERKRIAYKKHKITDEDWRNREKWDDYRKAVVDMIDKTSTELAPWTLVEAEDKCYARIKVLETVCEAVGSGMKKRKKKKS